MTTIARQLKLSASGMANIAPSKTENDFTFIVGNDSYPCPWFVAAFLSPRIGHLHSIDPTFNELEIETEDPDHQFESIVSIGRGGSIDIIESNSRFLASVASELGNFELYFSVHDLMQTNGTVSTFCEHFKDWGFTDHFSDDAIDFLAVHFWEFDKSFQSGLPISVLSQIFGHPSLRVESEDWLLDFIVSQIEWNPTFAVLLEFVRFDYLTKFGIDKFIAWSFDHFADFEMTTPLWRAITKRLSRTATADLPKSSRYPTLARVREDSLLDGIIAELTRIHGGNVHDREIVIVSASSIRSSTGEAAQNAADLGQKNYLHSLNAPDQWLRYDFKDGRIELADYSIAAYPGCFLRSWVVEGSDDGLSWTVLDERKGNTDANSNHPIAAFSVDRRMKCRFIRLRQTGQVSSGLDWLVLHAFEVFGRHE
jgi:hypothetical protein